MGTEGARTCNHESCTTRFCPHCGAAINATPGLHLRVYLLNQFNRANRDYNNSLKRDDKAWSDRKREHVKRWEGWLAFVDAALKAGETETRP